MTERRALLWALAAIGIWGTLAAAVGDALTGVRATTLVFWAFVFAAPLLVGMDVVRRRTLRQIFVAPRRIVALGAVGIFGYHALLFVALEQAPPVEANLLNYLWPLFMVVLAPAIARERPRASFLASALVGFVGAGLVVTQGESLHVEGRHALGYALAATAAFVWASFSLILKRLGPEGEDRMALFAVTALAASFVLALMTGGVAPPPGRALLAAAWLGAGPMGIAFHCWGRALALGSAARIGVLSYLAPLLSTLALAAALERPISAANWLGMGLIVGASAAPSLQDARARGQR